MIGDFIRVYWWWKALARGMYWMGWLRKGEDGLVINIIFCLLDQTVLQHPCNLVKGGIDLGLWVGRRRWVSWHGGNWIW